MRIIEQRDELKHACPHCQSLLGIEAKDLTETKGRWSYRCPSCKRVSYLERFEIPQRWWEQLDPTGA